MPHPRNYGTFSRILAHYVRDLHMLTLEDAVRRMTSLPAMRFRIFDRGLLRQGMKADVVVFDAATVQDKSTCDHPHQYSEGYRYVLVNGKIVLRDGRMTGERPGRVLYGPARACGLGATKNRAGPRITGHGFSRTVPGCNPRGEIARSTCE